MQITYSDATNSNLTVVLATGESLGHFAGPASISVPICVGNAEYDTILANNLTINSYVAPPASIPQSVALWAAKAALQKSGTLAEVNTIITALNDEVLNLYWSNGQTVSRTSPLISQIGSQLNLTSDEIDQLFVDADKITL
jgi:hypothetical protein